jgi:hypothetical protein
MRHALAIALVLVVAAAPAAPLPRNKGSELSEQYLLDDADMLAVVNVALVRSSPMYKDHFDKLVNDLLGQEPVAGALKEAGLDPRKDVDRVLVMLGHSCFTEDVEGGPVLLLQGRFDPAKMLAAAAKLAKDYPDVVKVEARGDARIIQVDADLLATFHAAVLDKSNVIVASDRALVEAALDKAAGKKKTDLKHKAFVELFRKTKFDHAVEVVATGNTITDEAADPDPDGKAERKFRTLANDGVESLRVVVDVKDEVKVSVTLAAKDATAALDLEKKVREGIKEEAGDAREETPQFAAALAAAKVGSKDKTVTIDGQGNTEAVKEMILDFLGIDAAEPIAARP